MSKQKYTYRSVFVALMPPSPNQYPSTTSTSSAGTYVVGSDIQEYYAAQNLQNILESHAKEGYQLKFITNHNHGVILVLEAYSDEYAHYNQEVNEYIKK